MAKKLESVVTCHRWFPVVIDGESCWHHWTIHRVLARVPGGIGRVVRVSYETTDADCVPVPMSPEVFERASRDAHHVLFFPAEIIAFRNLALASDGSIVKVSA